MRAGLSPVFQPSHRARRPIRFVITVLVLACVVLVFAASVAAAGPGAAAQVDSGSWEPFRW